MHLPAPIILLLLVGLVPLIRLIKLLLGRLALHLVILEIALIAHVSLAVHVKVLAKLLAHVAAEVLVLRHHVISHLAHGKSHVSPLLELILIRLGKVLLCLLKPVYQGSYLFLVGLAPPFPHCILSDIQERKRIEKVLFLAPGLKSVQNLFSNFPGNLSPIFLFDKSLSLFVFEVVELPIFDVFDIQPVQRKLLVPFVDAVIPPERVVFLFEIRVHFGYSH